MPYPSLIHILTTTNRKKCHAFAYEGYKQIHIMRLQNGILKFYQA